MLFFCYGINTIGRSFGAPLAPQTYSSSGPLGSIWEQSPMRDLRTCAALQREQYHDEHKLEFVQQKGASIELCLRGFASIANRRFRWRMGISRRSLELIRLICTF